MFREGEMGETHFLAALLGISEMVAGLTDRDEVLGTIVRIMPQLVGVDRGAILAYDERKKEFRTEVVHGPDRERIAAYERLVITEEDVKKLAHRILEQKLPALVRESSFPRPVASVLGIKMALVVPLVCRGRTLGIMILDPTTGRRLFTSKEINVVTGVAQQAAIALDNFRLQEEAQRAKEEARMIGNLFADGVLTLTADFRVVSLDPSAEALLQWRTSEVAGKGLPEAFEVAGRDGTRLPDASLALERALRMELGKNPPELQFRRKDGARVRCSVHTSHMRDSTGAIVEVLCALRRGSNVDGNVPVDAGAATDPSAPS